MTIASNSYILESQPLNSVLIRRIALRTRLVPQQAERTMFNAASPIAANL